MPEISVLDMPSRLTTVRDDSAADETVEVEVEATEVSGPRLRPRPNLWPPDPVLLSRT